MGAATRFCPNCHRTYSPGVPFCPLDGSQLRPVPDALPELSSVINDRYLILAHIASGGMGTIFRSHDIPLRREVALKVLKPELAGKENAVRRFFVEARAAMRLRHPNIIELFDFGVSREGYLFLAMELLPGITLARLLGKRDRLAVGEALLVSHGVCEALIHAHDRGVVHRDLKPENIFLVTWDKEGFFVKVLDFGVASVADTGVRGGLHRGEVLGTPAYMSPEQVRGDAVDRRSDLYSLGVMLYEMLSGAPPFVSENPTEVMRSHLVDPVPPLPALAVSHAVRKGVDGLLAAMLAKSRDDRLSNASEARARIRAVMDNLALEDARAVDAALFAETLSPLRSLVPFHERGTFVADLTPGEDPESFHSQPTVALDPANHAMANRIPTDVFQEAAATVHREVREAIPWTVGRHGEPAERGESVLVTLMHAEFEFGAVTGSVLSARSVFVPELEAFQAHTVAGGGAICFDADDEVRVVFGLYPSARSACLEATSAASALMARVKRFCKATGMPVAVRIGLATDRVPAKVVGSTAPDKALRGSPVDVAVRLARMAMPGQIVIDDETRTRVARLFDFEDLGRIRVRGRERHTRVFLLTGTSEAAKFAVGGKE